MVDPVSIAASIALSIPLGIAARELWDLLKNAIEMAKSFKSDYESLVATLGSIIRIIQEVESLNQDLDVPKEDLEKFTGKLNDGKELIKRCSTVSYNPRSRYKCAKAIRKLDAEICRFIAVDLQLVQFRDIRAVLLIVEELREKLDLILSAKSKWSINDRSFPVIPDLMLDWKGQLQEVKDKLFADDVSVLVLTGPGGSGKSTLASILCQDKEVRGIYNGKIYFVPISNEPNLKISVQELFKQVGFAELEAVNDKAALVNLERLLIHEEQSLVVLDDVWKDTSLVLLDRLFDLRSQLKCTVLITSRDELSNFGSTYTMKLLSEGSAMKLFLHLAFPEKGNYNIIDENIVNQIVKKCTRVPLVVKVIASSLCRQPIVSWKNTMKKLEDHSVVGLDKDLYKCLSISLIHLDDKLRNCFLNLGLFPEDHLISSSVLKDIWSELYGLDEDDVLGNLFKLCSRNLANLRFPSGKVTIDEIDGCYNELCVSQHDMLRELAIYQNNMGREELRKNLLVNVKGNDRPKFLKEKMHQSFNAQILSISTDENFTSWSDYRDMKLPEVEALILNFRTQNYTLPKFMMEMCKLKSLIITNHGLHHAELSNLATGGCVSIIEMFTNVIWSAREHFLKSLIGRSATVTTNIRRIRLEKISIPSLNKLTIQMENLRKISLVFCKIGDALKNCTTQLSVIFPNIEEIEIDYCNDLVELPVGFSEMKSLKQVSITDCHKLSKLPENMGENENLEVLRLHSCTELGGLPESIGSLTKLRILDISDCLGIKELPERIGELSSLIKLDMRGCSKLRKLPKSIANLGSLSVICDEEALRLWNPFKLKPTVAKQVVSLSWLGL